MDGVLAANTRRYHEAKAEGAAVTHRSDFFNNFSSLAESMGVYTAQDYAECVDHLLKRWRISQLQVQLWLACVCLVLWRAMLGDCMHVSPFLLCRSLQLYMEFEGMYRYTVACAGFWLHSVRLVCLVEGCVKKSWCSFVCNTLAYPG